MKKPSILAAILLATAAHATAVWNIDLHAHDSASEFFQIDGQFTTAGLPGRNGTQVLSFTGTFSDDLELFQPITLIPPGRSVDTFTYDDLFFRTNLATAFDNSGLLFNAGLSNVNLYTDAGALFGYDSHGFNVDFSQLDGSITLDHVSAVMEPTEWLMWVAAFFCFFIKLFIPMIKRCIGETEEHFWRDAHTGERLE